MVFAAAPPTDLKSLSATYTNIVEEKQSSNNHHAHTQPLPCLQEQLKKEEIK
jgi:hypothetical protein